MFNNTTNFGSGGGAVVPTSSATVPTTVFPGSTITSNSTFIIIGPPPPFPASPRSIDFSPLKLIFAVIAIVAVPALAYALFFAVPCSSGRRNSSSSRSSRSSSSDDTPHVTVDISPPITSEREAAVAAPDSGVTFQKETHSKEIGNECTVCLSVFADGEEIRQLSACKHAFHVSCIEMWLKDHPNCPICRADVSVKQTEANADADVNGNVNRSGGNRRVSATSRDDDWRQDILHIFSYLPRYLNFIEHTSNIGWKENQRARPIIIDPGFYHLKKSGVFWAKERRSLPASFKLFMGSTSVALTRPFLEFCIWGWDNLPRTLLMYYTNFLLSSEGYFQTVVCNNKDYQNTTVNHDLHYTHWDPLLQQRALNLTVEDFRDMVQSGAPFAREFQEDDTILDKIDAELLGQTDGGLGLKTLEVVKPTVSWKRLEKLMVRLLDHENFRAKQCK